MPQATVRVVAAGVASVVGSYAQRSPKKSIPDGFAAVCTQQRWSIEATWKQLCDFDAPYFEHENGSYMYRNIADGQWWIDEPNGGGVYVALSQDKLPPSTGWKALSDGKSPLPQIEIAKE